MQCAGPTRGPQKYYYKYFKTGIKINSNKKTLRYFLFQKLFFSVWENLDSLILSEF